MGKLHLQFSRTLLLAAAVACNVYAIPVISSASTSSGILVGGMDEIYQLSDIVSGHHFEGYLPRLSAGTPYYATYFSHNISRSPLMPPKSSGLTSLAKTPLWTQLWDATKSGALTFWPRPTEKTLFADHSEATGSNMSAASPSRRFGADVEDRVQDGDMEWDFGETSGISELKYKMQLADEGFVADGFPFRRPPRLRNFEPVERKSTVSEEVMKGFGSRAADVKMEMKTLEGKKPRESTPLAPTRQEIEGMKGRVSSTLVLHVGPLRTPTPRALV
ncbi:hypothetical protein RUND412_010390 [Rhizina undulata]